MSPTTVSGIETGKISRPHFGTLRKVAQALGIDPQVLLSVSEEPADVDRPALLSLQWARSTEEEEFEREVEGASLDRLESLACELREERGRLQRLYGEFPEGSEQRRYNTRQNRDESAQSGSLATSIMFRDEDAKDHIDGQREAAGEPRRADTDRARGHKGPF